MPKVNEIVYDIREAIKAYTDDSEVDDRYILYLYDIKRAKYLRQELNNYLRSVDNSVKQTVCLPLEEVSASECSCAPQGCSKLLRTKQPLPKPIELHSKQAITKVKPSMRLALPFNFVSKEKASVADGAPYKAVYAFLDVDNHIYLYSEDESYRLIKYITVTGVFEKPLELADYQSCDGSGSSCFNQEEEEYPLQPHFVDVIRDEVIRDILRTYQIPEDKINDDTD